MRVKSLITKMMLVILISANLTSCASIINGKTQRIPINSYPDGATVYVDGQMAGFTPTSVVLDRSRGHNITLAREGYAPATMRLRPRVSLVVGGNILTGAAACYATAVLIPATFFSIAGAPFIYGSFIGGALVGCVVDHMTGGAYTLSRPSVNVSLIPQR